MSKVINWAQQHEKKIKSGWSIQFAQLLEISNLTTTAKFDTEKEKEKNICFKWE